MNTHSTSCAPPPPVPLPQRGEGIEMAPSPSERERVGVRVRVCSRIIRPRAPVFRALVAIAAGILVAGLGYALLAPWAAPYDPRPGAPVGQILGVIAACLMIAALLYLPAKRSDVLDAPNRRLVLAHIVLGVSGAGVALA